MHGEQIFPILPYNLTQTCAQFHMQIFGLTRLTPRCNTKLYPMVKLLFWSSGEYRAKPSIAIILRFTLSNSNKEVTVLIWVFCMGQIDSFENHLYYIGILNTK